MGLELSFLPLRHRYLIKQETVYLMHELFSIQFIQTEPNIITIKLKHNTSFMCTSSSNTRYNPWKKMKVRGDAERGRPLWLFIIVHHLCPWKALKLQRVHKASLMQAEPEKTPAKLYTDCVKPGLMHYPCGRLSFKEQNKED